MVLGGGDPSFAWYEDVGSMRAGVFVWHDLGCHAGHKTVDRGHAWYENGILEIYYQFQQLGMINHFVNDVLLGNN